jgi:hypothetical protein
MALPASGQISFADFVTEEGFIVGGQTNMFSYALVYGVPFQTDGSDSIGMDEFYGKNAPLYDVYEYFEPNPPNAGIINYYIRWVSSNPPDATFDGNCAQKVTFPSSGLKLGEVADVYPNAIFRSEAGADCGGGGGFEP